MTYVVQTNKLTKTIGEKNLVTNVSMHVKKGEINKKKSWLNQNPPKRIDIVITARQCIVRGFI